MNFFEIFSTIEESFISSSVTFKPKNLHKDDWLFVQQQLYYLPVLCSESSIQYQEKYFSDLIDEIKDLSQIIYLDKRPIGIFSLTLSMKDNNLKLSSQGLPLIQPLLVSDISKNIQKKIYIECSNLVHEIVMKFEMQELILQEIYENKYFISEWYENFLSKGYASTNQFQLILNLEKEYSEIKKNYRKRYKSLINAGKKKWNIKILESNYEYWDEFKKLHREVSGRKTRSDSTWEIQKDNLKNADSVFIYLTDSNSTLVGGAYFDMTKTEAIYSVGVYKRELFDQPLGHLIQDKAIQFFLSKNLKRYKIGQKPFSVNDKGVSDKEISIAHFKSGFGANLIIEPQLKYENVNYEN